MSTMPFPTPPFGLPQGEPGGAQAPAQKGFAGFFDRFMNPTNGLGQFGRALVMAGGTPLGDAYALMDKSKADSEAAGLDRQYKQAQIAHLGQGPEATALERNYNFLMGKDPALGKAFLESQGDPIKTAVQQNPDGTTTLIPYRASQFGTSAAPGALAPSTPLGAPEVAPAPAVGGDMLGITARSESGNRDFNADGSLVTSPKGAMGRMQVMPNTARDPGFGVRPAASNDPAELARVGKDYLGAMMARYKDPAKAWAAYNGGPGRLDRVGGNIDAMPAETRNYVAKNTKALGGGNNSAKLIADAQAAIAAGADPAKVQARLRQMGVQ